MHQSPFTNPPSAVSLKEEEAVFPVPVAAVGVPSIKPERTEMKNPVNVLRLPRGPDPHSRGFDPSSPRYVALCPSSIPASATSCTDLRKVEEEQRIRSELRERFLRTLIAMTDKQVHFRMYEKVQVQAKFGASDIDVLNFQVSDLQTPLGVQKEALLRCQDVISYSFNL
ncbi:hypothetical protein KOW79_002982 [Hemibagrus wyckioides]|uniref:Gem-associated protein 7 n=2 Tax=Hemibagrus wyckioides TaxID=337641 RepID=A0A9D3P1W1_9TELE|nr:hypothetical protein KOW79_002982 [Hemibagrus wyckioides]